MMKSSPVSVLAPGAPTVETTPVVTQYTYYPQQVVTPLSPPKVVACPPQPSCPPPQPSCPPPQPACPPAGQGSPQQYVYQQQGSYSSGSMGGANWVWAIIVFVIIVIIIWLLLWAFKPTWVQKTSPCGKPTGEIDNGKALLWAIVLAIIITIIIWIIIAAASC